MKKTIVILSLLCVLTGCRENPYTQFYSDFSRCSCFEYTLFNRIIYSETQTQITESDIYIDYEKKLIDIESDIYSGFSSFHLAYSYSDGMITAVNNDNVNSFEGEFDDLKEMTDVSIPEIISVENVKNVTQIIEKDRAWFSLTVNEDCVREIAEKYIGDILEEYDYEIQQYSIEMTCDRKDGKYSLIQQDIHIILQVYDENPHSIEMQLQFRQKKSSVS